MNYTNKYMYDLKKWTKNVTKKTFFKYLFLPQFKLVYLKRKCEKKRQYFKFVTLLFKYIYKHYQIKYNIEIPSETVIGKGFKIAHIGGIVVNSKVLIGDNVTILNGVLIGYEPRGIRKGTPTIKNNVWIGSNAAIVGNIEIGNNVLIAPNSFVNFNVPDNSIVIGNPAKIIKKENAVKDYITVNI